jgi:sialate O-acetylesterase
MVIKKMKRILFLITLLISSFVHCQIKLPRLISDGMVLQRDRAVKIWGWASPNEKIELDFNQKKYNAIASNEGKWTITLPSQKAGGPYEMTFLASNKIVLKNILFGDVWICGGQSNMELPMERVKDKYKDVIAKANNSNIRQFMVPDKFDFEKPNEDVDSGEWIFVNTENILKFSAVAYFFADEIYAKYKIPIGLINSALGGSPAESWISEDAIKKFPDYYNEAQKFKNKGLIEQIESNDKTVNANWYNILNANDEGLKDKWSNLELDDSDWQKMNIPGYWADNVLGNVNGAIWFRKEFVLTKENKGEAKLLMGRIVDADSVFINGKFVGTTSYLYPPRRYLFDSSILKEGKNEIAIRVINNSGKGGFVFGKPYELILSNETIDLKGEWKYKLGTKMDALPSQTFVRWKPVGLFNAMIAPLTNYSIKGVIWYQGEANVKKPSEYFDLMQTVVSNWRSEWKQGNFPFLYVQLANFMELKSQPTESSWAELRQQQTNLLSVSNTGMAVAMDLGEWNDIHPLNKYDVGKRLALQAKKLAYGDKKIVSSGPLFKSMKLKENKLILKFSEVGSGLMAKGNQELKGFAIAGEDNRYVWAKATIQGDEITVWSDTVLKPYKVRYAWADNPEGANLYNREDLPASPFEATLGNK